MRVTPKISDIPTETRNRNIPTLSPLITCTAMSGPLVSHGKRCVTTSIRRDPARAGGVARLLLLRRGRPQLSHLVAALDDVLAVGLLDVGDVRLAVVAHLHHALPLRRQRLLITAAHDDLAPRELH